MDIQQFINKLDPLEYGIYDIDLSNCKIKKILSKDEILPEHYITQYYEMHIKSEEECEFTNLDMVLDIIVPDITLKKYKKIQNAIKELNDVNILSERFKYKYIQINDLYNMIYND